jgi:diguanylate cyclase (GGDEF)-like protein
MGIRPPHFASLVSSLTRPRRIGIVGRLSVSFVAVAVLAIAANFMVDHSDIVQNTRVQTIISSPPLTKRAPAASVTAASLRLPPAMEYARSLELFTQAALNRVSADAADTEQGLQAETSTFAAAAASLDARLQGADRDAAKQLSEASKAVESTAEGLVRTSDSRHLAMREYRRHLDALNEAVQSALDGSFKIFGRFIAHQYLLQLAHDFESFREHFDLLISSDASTDALRNLAAIEERVTSSFAANEASLTRTQGRDWMAMANQELTALALQREILQRLQEPYRAQRAALTHDKISALAAMERGLAAVHALQMNTLLAAVPSTPPAAMAEPQTAALPMDTITVTPRDRRGDELIAWITVGVIALVLLISLVTVLSIVRPVRRLLRAADRLSQGDTRARVQRGGLRELDELAAAFNRMAEDLSRAHEISRFYQERLESDVAARTLELKELAERDPLTHLPNRRHWLALMGESISSARRRARLVGVYFIDLDNFKTINDSLGHAFGDKILRVIADRLMQVSASFGYAARLGGDEFSVIYSDAQSAEEIERAGWQLVQAFHTALLIDQRELMVSVSVGVSIFPGHGAAPDELLSAADAALFRAKTMGRNQLNVFTPDLLHSANQKFTIEQRLRRAIERNELELVYQPEMAVGSQKVIMVEALLRWRQPDGRLAAPAEFLGVAETSGFIADIDTWVLRTAIETAAAWHHRAWPEARVAVNVSPRQLLDAAFLDRLQELLLVTRLPPRCIELELTETVLQTGAATIQMLHRLKERGIAIALDDFGTGYSSLTSLEQLPLSRVKLDRSLIAGLGANDRSAAIVRAIITLCEHLQLEVTAEGIETEQQLAWLTKYPSLSLQGYLITRPLSRNDVLPAFGRLHQQLAHAIVSLPRASGPSLFIAGSRK